MTSHENEETEEKTVKGLTAKEIKKLARPEFAANPDKFYPTKTLRKLGYERAQCPECDNNFWRRTDKRRTCGDSNCEKQYSFIGKGTGRGRKGGSPYTYAEAWNGFKRSLTTARIPCSAVDRYPVVARWRADVDFVAAGIFCFQPYCVTGELEPPANPLIQPQFCLRFNDLDNIGITGRHYSGFVMLGIQVFNKPGKMKFWADECIEFNYRWLTEELGIDPDEITFIEDVWAGGGNLGPSIEYFVGGLELGNMVFMQFKTFPDGHREPLEVQVIDVGIGLERVPWLVNGTGTSYMDVFHSAFAYLLDKLKMTVDRSIWDKFGPYSCLLNVDEVKDLDQTWNWIAQKINMTPQEVKAAIDPIKDLYVVLDHTRTVLMAVEDGSLPSNVGGASNIRNILRRTFAILTKRGWWDILGMDGFLEIFKKHKEDLSKIYGQFKEYKSLRTIMQLEYERWQTTDEKAMSKISSLIKKRKGNLTLDDWIECVTSHGIPADAIARLTNTEIPGNLWLAIAELRERIQKPAPVVLYSTQHLPATVSTYYADHLDYEFDAKILEVFPNVTNNEIPNIVVLDRSAFYPTSGGQEHDTGILTVKDKEYKVVDVMKVGPCVLHVLDEPLPIKNSLDEYKGVKVLGKIDQARRDQLRNNHTATHIVYASCRQVLGPHVWQNGAKKTLEGAHLDITHFQSLTPEEVLEIQGHANRIVQRCRQITKGFMPKDEAERKYGFHLYQGGVVPGNELRVVDIAGIDTEACCGTHADNTAEVGNIKILKTQRISDGIVRLYFVAGEKAIAQSNQEAEILFHLSSSWGVSQQEIPATAERFFAGYKALSTKSGKQEMRILNLAMKVFLLQREPEACFYKSDQPNPTLFISLMPQYAAEIKKQGKTCVFLGKTFIYGLVGDTSKFNPTAVLGKFLASETKAEPTESDGKGAKQKQSLILKDTITIKADPKSKKQAEKITGICEFSSFSVPPGASGQYNEAVVELLRNAGLVEAELD